MLTLDQVSGLLRYDPTTGHLFWKKTGARAGWKGERGYRRVNLLGASYYEHRVAWLITRGVWPVDDIDHINGARDDNRDANLREATRLQNLMNSAAKGGSSMFKGVHFNRRRSLWQAYISIGRHHKYLGAFADECDAAAAYDRAAADLFGPFAKLNLVERETV